MDLILGFIIILQRLFSYLYIFTLIDLQIKIFDICLKKLYIFLGVLSFGLGATVQQEICSVEKFSLVSKGL